MKIEVSNGELLDRISILEIKKLNMQDPENLANVELEFLTLNPGVVDLFTKNGKEIKVLFLELSKVNRMLWDLENRVRDKSITDKEFRKASLLIFEYNEVRNQLKNDINIISGSNFKDIKEYR
ncbi:hypothetical protein N9L94_00975 [Robiginitalea sp.]|jgi:hypothetical protein|nr:hypothetical protein [Robiginitalea sp.]|tara:strand:+ start:119 stop:487 length:369 start_codon:yes stop_codon:yes gene_type:complete